MEKSKINSQDTKTISFVIDSRNITSEPTAIELVATKGELNALKEEYQIPQLSSLSVKGQLHKKDNLIYFTAKMTAQMKRECIITGELFAQNMNTTFKVLFATDKKTADEQNKRADLDINEEPCEYIPKGQIYFKGIISEQFCLALDPFPRSSDQPFSYIEANAKDYQENPFSVLKRLTK